jgi:hypothetical protein
MEISELTLKLILLLVPGALASIIFEKLTIHKKWSPFQFISNSILFGSACYLGSQLCIEIFCAGNDMSSFWSNLPAKEIPFTTIIKAIIASPFIGLLFTCADHFRWINKVGRFLRISNKYGDLNLFTHFLNSPDVKEIYVRDIERNITYHGKVHSYSETDDIKELLLYDVDIYDYATNDLCYSVKSIYISKPKDNIWIEIPEIMSDERQANETNP